METTRNSDKGQTVIETALMIMLLFVLFFGIAEVARFWWLKNQINNAARVAVRVAVVDTSSSIVDVNGIDVDVLSFGCTVSGTNCVASGSNSGSQIAIAGCSALTNSAVCSGATGDVRVSSVDSSGNPSSSAGSEVSPGGIIKVVFTSPPVGTIVPGLASLSLGLIPVDSSGNITLTSQSTMRHE
jgi:Flp pilus assembly protein TadG